MTVDEQPTVAGAVYERVQLIPRVAQLSASIDALDSSPGWTPTGSPVANIEVRLANVAGPIDATCGLT